MTQIVLNLTVLLGCKDRNAFTYLKVRPGTNKFKVSCATKLTASWKGRKMATHLARGGAGGLQINICTMQASVINKCEILKFGYQKIAFGL